MGDKTKAKSAYQDFLAIWQDADPDIPILKTGSSGIYEPQLTRLQRVSLVNPGMTKSPFIEQNLVNLV